MAMQGSSQQNSRAAEKAISTQLSAVRHRPELHPPRHEAL